MVDPTIDPKDPNYKHIEVETVPYVEGQPAIRTIKSLRLDLESARNGEQWKLLPPGFRDQPNGNTYPLPTGKEEVQIIASIYIPPHSRSCGATYVRRAIAEWKGRAQKRQSAIYDIALREQKIKRMQDNFALKASEQRARVRKEVERVKQEADLAIASLTDLFALGRRGIDAQMQAHLEGKEWQGETITARAFRECFRMVTQAVGNLRLPTGQRKQAEAVIMDEVAAALKDTQETVALAPGQTPGETEH